MVTYRKCACGDPVCDQYTLSDQGSVGFTLDRARLYAAAEDMLEALRVVREDYAPESAANAWLGGIIAKAEGKD